MTIFSWKKIAKFFIVLFTVNFLLLQALLFLPASLLSDQRIISPAILATTAVILFYFFFIKNFRGEYKKLHGVVKTLHASKDDLEKKLDLQNDELAQVNDNLALMLDELEENVLQQEQVATMTGMLQSCSNTDEAYNIFKEYTQNLCPGLSGTLWVVANSRNYLEIVCEWGDIKEIEQIFLLNDCWALRRGKNYISNEGIPKISCKHLHLKSSEQSICIPLNAHGEILALFTLSHKQGEAIKHFELLARQITDTMAITLSNLRLREKLLNQSIRDSLTNLYNRRYMEEFLDRELQRAQRQECKFTIAMIDIDHFKAFNDSFGHRMGDYALAQVAKILSSKARNSDIVCRYGGEEFLIIMPGAELQDAEPRFEDMRQGVESADLHNHDQVLDSISISIGIATYPIHGSTVEGLITTADQALYQAKKSGRNRIVVSENNQLNLLPY